MFKFDSSRTLVTEENTKKMPQASSALPSHEHGVHHHHHRSLLEKAVKTYGNKQKLQFFPHDHTTKTDAISSPPPLVVVIGWYGSKFRFVSKYVEIYTAKGFDVLAYIPDSLELFIEYFSIQGVKAVLDMVEKDQRENETGFMLHCFSNNGGFFLAKMMAVLEDNVLQYEFVKKQYKGVIADSFPGINTEDTGAMVVLAGYPYDKKEKKIIPDKTSIGIFGIIIRFLLYYFFYYYYQVSNGSVKFYAGYLDNLKKIPAIFGKDSPILVIYADADFIVPSKMVREFWSNYKGASNLDIKCFEGDIDHIKIFVSEPQKYRSAVENFCSNNL